jgi:hypothetical protein
MPALPRQVSQEIGEMWHAAGQAEKSEYEAKADKDRRRYDKASRL